MANPKQVFHLISYLQYPFMLAALGLYVPFVLALFEQRLEWGLLNHVLILMGVSLSFSTLQDTKQTQNKISKRIWQDPRKGKLVLTIMAVMALLFIVTGLLTLLVWQADQTESVAVGVTVLGIGMLGMLKAALEMFENHRLDKNPADSTGSG